MIAPYASFHENKVKHLDMIQSVIARLGNDSFLVKGWALTVAGAFFGFAIQARKPGFAWASLVPTVLFWGLDVYFLRAERLFRALYDLVRSDDVEPFFMNAPSQVFVKRVKEGGPHRKAGSYFDTWTRPTLIFFYGILVIVAVVLICLIENQSSVLVPHISPSPTRSP